MKFPFSMWNYNRFEDFGHVGDADMDELAVWNRCGLTVPCLPRISCKDTDPAVLVPLLDRAASLGMKLIAHIDELTYPGVTRFGEDRYRTLCRKSMRRSAIQHCSACSSGTNRTEPPLSPPALPPCGSSARRCRNFPHR